MLSHSSATLSLVSANLRLSDPQPAVNANTTQLYGLICYMTNLSHILPLHTQWLGWYQIIHLVTEEAVSWTCPLPRTVSWQYTRQESNQWPCDHYR